MAASLAMMNFLLVEVIIMAFESCVQAAPSGQSSSSDTVEWLKVTVVPLLVLLIGSCLLGCIKTIRHWRTVSTSGGSAVSETGQVLGNSSGSIDAAPGELQQLCRSGTSSKCVASHSGRGGTVWNPVASHWRPVASHSWDVSLEAGRASKCGSQSLSSVASSMSEVTHSDVTHFVSHRASQSNYSFQRHESS